jgi:hypothetical protein
MASGYFWIPQAKYPRYGKCRLCHVLISWYNKCTLNRPIVLHTKNYTIIIYPCIINFNFKLKDKWVTYADTYIGKYRFLVLTQCHLVLSIALQISMLSRRIIYYWDKILNKETYVFNAFWITSGPIELLLRGSMM